MYYVRDACYCHYPDYFEKYSLIFALWVYIQTEQVVDSYWWIWSFCCLWDVLYAPEHLLPHGKYIWIFAFCFSTVRKYSYGCSVTSPVIIEFCWVLSALADRCLSARCSCFAVQPFICILCTSLLNSTSILKN